MVTHTNEYTAYRTVDEAKIAFESIIPRFDEIVKEYIEGSFFSKVPQPLSPPPPPCV